MFSMLPWVVIPPALILIPQLTTTLRFAAALTALFIGILTLWQTLHHREEPSRFWQSAMGGYMLTGLFLLAIQEFPIGVILGRPLLLPHSEKSVQAIVVLAGGFHPHGNPTFGGLQRTLHAIDLFRDGRAPLIVFSTSSLENKDGYRESTWVASLTRICQLASVSYEIVREGETTITEARALAKILLPRGLKEILVVTNGPHIRRTVKCFEKQGFTVFPAPAQTRATFATTADSSSTLFNFAIHEWIGLTVYWLRGDIDFPFDFSP